MRDRAYTLAEEFSTAPEWSLQATGRLGFPLTISGLRSPDERWRPGLMIERSGTKALENLCG